ncbi:cell division protein ZapA [Ideonella livida]|uniref:Cell division protein ZapA n=1 Tax=Ideonella livida TaxID=2707176 RepID=A0A7C9PHT2_9BURK|nr:cell division protein ZapA [Ideonella livida]NDY91394.1 cell division protein ZapA [Ideonella livida]
MKQLECTILGQGYLLGCPEGCEEQMRAAVELVDREMSAIRDAGRVKARERMAVLAALNIAFKSVQTQHENALAAARAAEQAASAAVATAPDAAASDEEVDRLIDRIDSVLSSHGHLP